ncbi:MAG: polyribonucleotide nucleotidyltransferase, partial [Candidatus Nucleicultricaceae bacterium]
MSMFKVFREEIEWGGRTLTIETGKIARQAEGAVVITYGQTSLLCTVSVNKAASDVDFFPLTVHYQERAFAAGRIPGGYFKREGKPSEKSVLASRLI